MAEIEKFLDATGLTQVWNKIKNDFQPKGKIDVTDTTPTTTTKYYPIYTSGTGANQTARANGEFYYYDSGTWSSVNIGTYNKTGILTLHNGSASADYYVNISPATMTTNQTITVPNKSGTMALTSDIPTNYLTSHSYRPIQVNGTQILANSSSSALNLKAGSNVTISNSSGTVTISATGGSGGGGFTQIIQDVYMEDGSSLDLSSYFSEGYKSIKVLIELDGENNEMSEIFIGENKNEYNTLLIGGVGSMEINITYTNSNYISNYNVSMMSYNKCLNLSTDIPVIRFYDENGSMAAYVGAYGIK